MNLKTFEKALQQFHKKKYAEAHIAFSKLAADTDSPEFRERCRGYAKACSLRMEETDPKMDPVARAVFLSNSGCHGEALEILTEIVKTDSRNDALLFTLSCLYAAMGEVNKAVEMLRKAVKLNPDNRVHALNHRDFRELKDTITAL